MNNNDVQTSHKDVKCIKFMFCTSAMSSVNIENTFLHQLLILRFLTR